jgi:3D (Asp-Asp-Asp) domain-containing protein
MIGFIVIANAGCAGDVEDVEDVGGTHDEIRVVSSFTSRGTGYYPSSSALEGGFKDRLGKPLKTLQQFLNGSAPYVSVAMDSTAFKYGTRLRVRELDDKYGRTIVFRVVDTGGAFRGKGRSRMDICVQNRSASLDKTINGTLHVEVIDEKSGPPPVDDTAGNDKGDEKDPGKESSGDEGRSCSNSGECNPGSVGSGMMCSAGKCVAGCTANWMCPNVCDVAAKKCR